MGTWGCSDSTHMDVAADSSMVQLQNAHGHGRRGAIRGVASHGDELVEPRVLPDGVVLAEEGDVPHARTLHPLAQEAQLRLMRLAQVRDLVVEDHGLVYDERWIQSV
jgi:hypothetical protein